MPCPRLRRSVSPPFLALVLTGAAGAVAGCAAPAVPVRHAAAVATVAATTPSPRPVTARVVPRVVWPLTGLPATGDVSQAALSVKIDNAPAARPQRGLNNADVVVETPVEGGLSRFFAVFDSQAATIGPIRSARPVDGALLRALNGGVFAYSGAATGEIAPARAYSTAVLLSADNNPGPFWRSRSHPAPDNLYASSSDLRSAAARLGRAGAPPALFHYGPLVGASQAAQQLAVRLGSFAQATWSWDGTGYRRAEQGSPHLLEDGSVVTTTNVLVLTVGVAHSGITDANHVEDPFVLAYGSGSALLVRDGKAVAGRWSRPQIGSRFVFTRADGRPLLFAPGRTWVELVPQPGGAIPAGSFTLS